MEPSEKASNTTVNDQVKKFIGDTKFYEQGENKEIIIRSGKAEEIMYPKAVNLSGVISAPAKFFEKRKDLHDNNKCHLLFDKQIGKITLVVDEQNAQSGYQVIGLLMPNPDLKAFKIDVNGKPTGRFSIKEMMDTLKFNRIFFVDKDLNAKIVTSLMNFKAKVQTELEAINNQRGDQRDLKATKLSHDLAEYFVLRMPNFKGLSNIDFRVDILCEITSAGEVTTWLESKELAELTKSALDTVIDAELELFKDIVCIEQ